MITGSSKFRSIQHLLRDRAGNFGILTALAIPVVAAAAGVAVDVSNMAVSDSQLQEATDAAALATATALANGSATTSNAQQLAADFVTGQMSNYLAGDASATSALKDRPPISRPSSVGRTHRSSWSGSPAATRCGSAIPEVNSAANTPPAAPA